MNIENLCAIYAAILSTILAALQWYQQRPKFDIQYRFTSNPEINDIIAVYNQSNRTVVIHTYELIRNDSTKKQTEKIIDIGKAADFYLLSIAPQSILKIQISEQYKFKVTSTTRLYLNLHLMGKKRPIKLLFHP